MIDTKDDKQVKCICGEFVCINEIMNHLAFSENHKVGGEL